VTYAKIKLSFADDLATIALADPATMNAAGVDTITELADAFGRVAKGENGARAVILTGEGRGFCSDAISPAADRRRGRRTAMGGPTPAAPSSPTTTRS
jgi:enoyl-CoA hydratase/carnithine racemase